MKGFTDADYAGCIVSRKSRSGFVFLLNGAPITWSSKRQSVVAQSTTEAEYVALNHGSREAVWLHNMLNQLDLKISCIQIFVDNQSTIRLALNADHHNRTKHIDIRYHYVRDIVLKELIKLNYVNTHDQLADIFTKPLPIQTVCAMRERLNIVSDTK